MRIAPALISAAIIFSPGSFLAAQIPATGMPQSSSASAPPAPAPATPPPPAPAPPVSAMMQPAIGAVQRAVSGVRIDKWKKGNVREEANQNINQILRDVQENLPPLLHDADASQGSLSKLLPVSRNVSALYDVLLRVVEASRVAGPDDQVDQLQKALVSLGDARLALGTRRNRSPI